MNFSPPPYISAHHKNIFTGIFLTLLLFPVTATAADVLTEVGTAKALLEKFDKGYINWKSGEYVANVIAPVPSVYRGKPVNQAMGKELAFRVSRALADSVFLQIVADTRVDAKHRLSQLVKTDTEIKLVGNIRGKKLVATKWITRDGQLMLQASYRIRMRGVDGVISQIYDEAIEARPAMPSAAAKSTTNKPGHGKSTTGKSNSKDNRTATTVYIDARGTGLQPALFPCIMDQQHNRLFDPADAGKSYIAEYGVVEYMVVGGNQPLSTQININGPIVISSLPDDADSLDWLVNPSAADETVTVKKRKKRKALKATEAEGLLKSNIIVGTDDAERLRKAQESGELDIRPNIIVITDGTIGGTEGMLTAPESLWALLSAR